ncbi:LacI family DNA-binding transcriptional regulator [Acidisoma sp. S159]|uniref:LacI family DNA-binding transcriptional regulator n=1 Tax=Acidisoma sp. S159 TaxID=1747225 RepID=UPI00131CF1DF|nr:LacI family DNA-binding transcriptional regulator [Acidisoma sp. S159]
MGRKPNQSPLRRRITIHDVAKETGFAVSTISNALAGKSHVSEETRARIQEIAERIGYRASSAARSLRLRQSLMIGVLVADVANPASPDFLRGIEDVATQNGYDVLLCNTDGSEKRQIAQMRALLDRNVDGIILISQHCSSPEIRALLADGTPYVLLQRRTSLHADDYVGADNVNGIGEAVAELARLGHRRVGFIRGPADSSTAAERYEGFCNAVAQHGLDPDPALVHDGDYSVERGYRVTLDFLSSSRPPSAIIASNDMNALGVLDAAAAKNVQVPEQLSVIGYDNVIFAGFARISLTTIDLPKREMGAAAATLLMKRINSRRRSAPKTVIFPTRLVLRGSTGPAAEPQSAAASHNRIRSKQEKDRP